MKSEKETPLREEHFSAEGALLITHTGVSGPAVLKLSSFAVHSNIGSVYVTYLLLSTLPDTDNDYARRVSCMHVATEERCE